MVGALSASPEIYAVGMGRKVEDIGAAFVVGLAAALIGWWLARSRARTVGELSAGAQRIARGDLRDKLAVPDVDELAALAETWRPYRGVAANLLWSYYRAAKSGEIVMPAAGPAKRSRPRSRSARATRL